MTYQRPALIRRKPCDGGAELWGIPYRIFVVMPGMMIIMFSVTGVIV